MSKLTAYYEKQTSGANKNLTPKRDDITTSDLHGNLMQVGVGVATLKPTPAEKSETLSQLLYGEQFTVLEEKDGWAWGQSQHDFYVGYVPLSALVPLSLAPTHRARNLTTNLYIEPNAKSQTTSNIPLNSMLAVCGFSENGHFAKTKFGWVPTLHIMPISDSQNYVDVAEMFLGCPYLWGGRSLLGIDCSGLVQAALNADGIKAPRDTGMQFDALGAKPIVNGQAYERGDIVFFLGHVGIMADHNNLIHANAFHMKTVVEPLADVINRPKGNHSNPLTGIAPRGDILAII